MGLGLSDEYFKSIALELQARRDQLVPALHDAGFTVYPTQATYFVTVDCAPIVGGDGGSVDGRRFVERMAREAGVVAIPNVVFYSEANRSEGSSLVRFAFCKRTEVIAEAASRLRNWQP